MAQAAMALELDVVESPARTASRVTGEAAPANPEQALATEEKSSLELTEMQIKRTVLLFKKDQVLKAIAAIVLRFDLNLDALVRDRIVLEADLKAADLKLLLLYREWVLLKEFEEHDHGLSDKLKSKLGEKHDIHERVLECQSKLALKKAEIEQILLAGKELVEDFQGSLGESNKHEEYYLKLFRRKIKRSKVSGG